jgi:hypothetical protein
MQLQRVLHWVCETPTPQPKTWSFPQPFCICHGHSWKGVQFVNDIIHPTFVSLHTNEKLTTKFITNYAN